MTSPLAGVRLVALDLDGTLLPSSKVLTDRAVGVVRDLRAAGIETTLATGKGWNHTRRYAEELGIETPLVALEGALVATRDARDDAALVRRTLSPAAVRAIDDAVRGLDVGFFYCDDRRRTHAQRRVARWLPQIRIWDPHVTLVDDAPGGRVFGFTLIGPPDDVAAARGRVGSLALDDVDLFHASFWDGHDQLHARPAGVEKSTGLACAIEHLGVAPGEVLAAGDWWNDVAMLRMVGVAVAPGNAVEGALAEADHVLPGTCEDDAVAFFLEDALRRL